jgi:hypothetical protein
MRLLAVALLVLAMAACGPSTPVPAATTRATTAPTAAATAASTAAASAATAGARPAFLTYAFTNVRDGSKFTLSDFPGKSVLVIGMAVW